MGAASPGWRRRRVHTAPRRGAGRRAGIAALAPHCLFTCHDMRDRTWSAMDCAAVGAVGPTADEPRCGVWSVRSHSLCMNSMSHAVHLLA
mmetsp:Transcript_32135/g.88097  ORF Transcript_32135/g.88097 Transcript_32135/m.88097 type:complete len:90 (+) Transcript_32135:766-1035(+)|eukprot:5004480-Prymnesium_polylepis.1